MIVFYGADFKLNLTNLKITFVKENALFYDSFFKNYTLPFSLPMDDETSQKLGLIDLENTSGYTVKHFGTIFLDTYFEEAYLFITIEEGNIQGSIAFGKLTLPILETKLASLPFPLIKTDNINELDNSNRTKTYPEVSHSFPMVFDDNFHNESNYEAFEGIVNQKTGYDFVRNEIESETGTILNKNIVVPFPYVLGVLKLGLNSANLELVGDFPNNKANNNLVFDPKKHLEAFSTLTYENYQFSQANDEYLDGDVLIYEFNKSHFLNSIGSYELTVLLNFPEELVVRQLLVKRGDVELFKSVGNSVDQKIQINKDEDSLPDKVTVQLIIEGTTAAVENYNNFTFEKNEGKLNTFKNTFSLAEFMPDITFGAFLSLIKNWLNLKVTLTDSFVRMDYIESQFSNIEFKDERNFEIKIPKRTFNQAKIYKLKYSDDSEVFVDKTGRVNNANGYREEDIIEIDMKVEVLPVEARDSIFTAVRSEADFSLFLYNGVDADNRGVAVEKVDGVGFSLQEVYERHWKNWLNFRTNSETYNDKFTTHALEDFKINEGRFKYNKKHIYKTIKQTRLSETEWENEIESETF